MTARSQKLDESFPEFLKNGRS